MKSNPDDFRGNSRWMQAVNDYKKHFTEEEGLAVKEALRELRMTQLQQKLFDIMTAEPQEVVEQYDLDMADISIGGFGNASVARSGTPVEYGGTTTNIINTGLSSWTSPRQEIVEMKLELQKLRLQQEIDLELDRCK